MPVDWDQAFMSYWGREVTGGNATCDYGANPYCDLPWYFYADLYYHTNPSHPSPFYQDTFEVL